MAKKLLEWLELFWLRITTQLRWTFEFIVESCLYYVDIQYVKADLGLIASYWWKNPYRICAQYCDQKGENEIHNYGETPLRTMEKIAKAAHITKDDVVFELGAGRFRSCLWLAQFVGCKVVGLEVVPKFVEVAKKHIQKDTYLNLEIRQEDMFRCDFDKATVIYLNGTCIPDEKIHVLMNLFRKLKRGVRIISVSFALNEYDKSKSFRLVSNFEASFSWGKAEVYIQELR